MPMIAHDCSGPLARACACVCALTMCSRVSPAHVYPSCVRGHPFEASWFESPLVYAGAARLARTPTERRSSSRFTTRCATFAIGSSIACVAATTPKRHSRRRRRRLGAMGWCAWRRDYLRVQPARELPVHVEPTRRNRRRTFRCKSRMDRHRRLSRKRDRERRGSRVSLVS